MFNPFVLRKYAALIISGALTTIGFFIGTTFYGLMWGVASMLMSLLFSALIGSMLLKNPFTEMLEGKGLLAFNWDSTGVMQPMIVRLNTPYVSGIFRGKKISDIFDRNAIFNLAKPEKVEGRLIEDKENNRVIIAMHKKEYNAARFGFFHYPVLIWNDMLKVFLTKEFMSEKEGEMTAKHGLFYLNKKLDENTSILRDFARHIIDKMKPAGEILKNPIVWIIVAVVVIILLAMMFPSISSAISSAAGSATTATKAAAGGSGIVG